MKALCIALAAVVLAGLGCATHVSIAETRREDIATRSRVLAIAARNLDEAVRKYTATPAEQEAAQAVAQFHNEAEHFARASERWLSTDNVNDSYETLIDAWHKAKEAFAKLKPDALTAESWQRTVYEWEKLERATGYSGASYEKRGRK